MDRLEINAYYALGLPLYLALAALEVVLARRKGVNTYRVGVTLGNLSGGLGEVMIGLFLGPYLLLLYDLGYERLAIVHWDEGSVVPWILAFFLGDLCYYAYHRAGHSVAALWAIHGVHHQSEDFNLSIALRHPWFSDLYSAIFYIPLPLFGVPATQFFVVITLISFYALSIHSNLFARPSFYFFVTPGTHIVHHAKNPRYLNKNFSAVLTIWDRLFGTHVELDPADPPRLGTTHGYETHSGARSQWIFFEKIVAAARGAGSVGDALRAFVMPPGWRPAGVPAPRSVPARTDDEIPLATRLYAIGQFTFTASFALYVLWLRDRHPAVMLACSTVVILWSLGTIGALLDGVSTSAGHELIRLGATVLLGVGLATDPRYAIVGPAVASLGAASALWVVLARGRFAAVGIERAEEAFSLP